MDLGRAKGEVPHFIFAARCPDRQHKLKTTPSVSCHHRRWHDFYGDSHGKSAVSSDTLSGLYDAAQSDTSTHKKLESFCVPSWNIFAVRQLPKATFKAAQARNSCHRCPGVRGNDLHWRNGAFPFCLHCKLSTSARFCCFRVRFNGGKTHRIRA